MLKTLRRPAAEYRALLALMLPIILQNLASSSLGLADTLMVGALGQNELGGLNQANTVFFVLQLFTFGIQSGGSVLIAQYWGKRDLGAINRVMGMSFYLSFIFTLLTSTAITLFPAQIMSLTTNDPMLVDCAARYSKIVAYSFVLNSLTLVYLGAQRNAGNSKLGMTVLVSSMLINVFLNWVLIFGKLGFPALGLEGAAYATFTARIFEVVFVAVYALFVDKKIPLMPKKLLCPGKIIAKDYIKYATPVVINETLWSFGYSMYAVVFGHMHGAADIVAAYSITGSLERIMLVLCGGVGTAAAVIIGNEIGEGKSREKVIKTGNWLLTLSVITGLITALFPLLTNIFLLDPVVFRVFEVTSEAKDIVRMMILVTAVRVIFKTYNYMVIVGVLRGGGNVRVAMVLDIIFMYLWSIPACIVAAFVFDASITTVFLLAVSEDAIKAVIGGLLLRRGDWVRNLTRDNV